MMELSKDEKERQLDAKIAAIRAKNEEKLQRQREVEKDRKLAEKQNQSVTTAPRVKLEGEYEHHFVGPDRNDKVLAGAGAGGKQPPQRSIRREESYDKKDRPGDKKGGRLRDGEGPPPDPGYRFLADRWRDGSDSEHGEAEAENGDRPRRQQQRRDEQQPWARGGGGPERGYRGGGRGAPRGRGREGGRWGEGGGPGPRRDSDHALDTEWRGGGRGGGRGRGDRGGMRGPRGGSSMRGGPGRGDTENFLRDMRRNAETEQRRDWAGPGKPQQQQPRPGPRPLFETGDWAEQVS